MIADMEEHLHENVLSHSVATAWIYAGCTKRDNVATTEKGTK